MGDTRLQRTINERQRAVRRSIGEELRRVRLEADLSLRAVGRAAGIDPSHLARVEAGDRELSQAALIATAAALGHLVSFRLFPSTGPRVRDHMQTLMIEALLAILDPRWIARLEVAVYRPVRGVIDVVLRDRLTPDIVAGEAHSRISTVEQQVRWAGQKADALPSTVDWPWTEDAEPTRIGRLLLLRSTAATREVVRALPETFRAAYPGSSAAAYAALTSGTERWPGAAIVWVDVNGSATRVLQGPPRGLDT